MRNVVTPHTAAFLHVSSEQLDPSFHLEFWPLGVLAQHHLCSWSSFSDVCSSPLVFHAELFVLAFLRGCLNFLSSCFFLWILTHSFLVMFWAWELLSTEILFISPFLFKKWCCVHLRLQMCFLTFFLSLFSHVIYFTEDKGVRRRRGGRTPGVGRTGEFAVLFLFYWINFLFPHSLGFD